MKKKIRKRSDDTQMTFDEFMANNKNVSAYSSNGALVISNNCNQFRKVLNHERETMPAQNEIKMLLASDINADTDLSLLFNNAISYTTPEQFDLDGNVAPTNNLLIITNSPKRLTDYTEIAFSNHLDYCKNEVVTKSLVERYFATKLSAELVVNNIKSNIDETFNPGYTMNEFKDIINTKVDRVADSIFGKEANN